MLSYTGLRTKYGVLTNNTTSANLANGDAWINDAQRIFMSLTNGDFTEATATDVTVAGQQAYKLPYNYEKLYSVTVSTGTFRYPAREVVSRKDWNQLQLSTNVTASYPQRYFIDAGLMYLWPTPSTSAFTITYAYRKIVRDLSTADYTTGTVTLTNGSTVVTGSGTTFTTAMIGRFIKSNTDGFWYELGGFTSTTEMALSKAWQGTTAGSLAFTIGEMPIIPETFHPALAEYAAAEYWDQQGQSKRAAIYRKKWDEAVRAGFIDSANKTASMVLDEGMVEERIINPNLTITVP